MRTFGLGILGSQLVGFKDALVFPIETGVYGNCPFMVYRAVSAPSKGNSKL